MIEVAQETDVDDLSSTVQIFDMKTKRITAGEDMDFSGESMTAATSNDLIYVTGGRNNARVCLNSTHCY